MGSLMAGWSATPSDAEKVMERSKTSLTKDDIEAFWRTRQQAMEEHMQEAAAQKSANQEESSGGPTAIAIPKAPEYVEEVLQLPMAMSPDWWTRSNWAFLNDPPDIDRTRDHHSKYVAQFHVAAKATVPTPAEVDST